MPKSLKNKKEESYDKYTLPDVKEDQDSKTTEEIEVSQSVPNEHSFWRGGRGIAWAVIVFVSISVALVSGFLVYKDTSERLSGSQAGEGAAVTTTEPIATSVPKSAVKIQVLNGGGIAGSAAIAKTFLEGLGYQDVETGNADSYDFETTTVQVKETKKDLSDLLIKDLSVKYEAGTSSTFLDEENDFDVIVTIGVK